jgi:hydrogenase maturation protease
MDNKVLVIAIGNEFRGDDGAGIEVARRLAALDLPGVTILEQSGEGALLMDSWQTAATVFVIDAVQAGGPDGAVYRFDAVRQPLPARFFSFSSHAFGLLEAIAMGRLLERLPPRLIIYGLQGNNFEYGVGLTPAVKAGVDNVVGRLLAELSLSAPLSESF